MNWLLALWSRFRVSTRIGAAIILALISVQTFFVAQFLLTPAHQTRVYGLRWLAKAADTAASVAFNSPVDHRQALLRNIDADSALTIMWHPNRSVTDDAESHPLAKRIAATLRATLQVAVKRVGVRFHSVAPGNPPPRRGNLTFIPSDLEASFQTGALTDGEPDTPVPGFFQIDIQGPDDSWITLAPPEGARKWWYWPTLPLLGGTLVIVLISLFTTRRILSPLDQLTRAAQRLGTERTPVPIDMHGLGEFSSIAEAFNKMQERLKRFVDERTQMLAAMSHDLRTSLTRLRLELENATGEEAKEALTKEIDEMEAMIAATLTFASGDAKGEPSRTIDLAALIISLCDNVSDRGGDADYSGPNHARLYCQPVTIKRALANVVDNAVKYGGKVRVDLAMMPGSDTVRVSDDGPGIPPDRRQEAFAPFRRLETSRNRDTGGVGLGLTIARDGVHAHGGTIVLDNAHPRGLIVTITLPAQEMSVAELAGRHDILEKGVGVA